MSVGVLSCDIDRAGLVTVVKDAEDDQLVTWGDADQSRRGWARARSERMPGATGIAVVARMIFAIGSRLASCPPASQTVEYPSFSTSIAASR
jgi:hypothetical protein